MGGGRAPSPPRGRGGGAMAEGGPGVRQALPGSQFHWQSPNFTGNLYMPRQNGA